VPDWQKLLMEKARWLLLCFLLIALVGWPQAC
jgi:hypothetical protein